jgi:hypothetical protein
MTLQRTSPGHAKLGEGNHISVRSRVVRAGEDGVGFAIIPQEPELDGPNSGPVGKKAINKFLDQLKSERDHAIIQYLGTVLKTRLSMRNSGPGILGEPYEKTEG